MHFRLSIIVVVLFQQLALSQAPKQFNFQGVAIDSGGFIVSQKPIKIRFTFSGDSTLTKLSYQELVNARTDQFGQFTCMIGSGLALKGAFDSIPFSTGKVYLKTEMDINSSGIYINAGTSKLASVPYAYFAENASSPFFKFDPKRQKITIGDSNGVKISGNPTNIGIGNQTMRMDSGNFNIGIGSYSLMNNKANGATAVGYLSLSANTIGLGNTAIGFSSLSNNNTGNYNTALGWSALANNSSGNENTGIGQHSLASNSIGNYNTALGRVSLHWNKTGNENTAIGYGSLFSNYYGSKNTALGMVALQNDSGSNNTGVGYGSLGYKKFGNGNTALGYLSGRGLDSGSNNVFIGNNAGNSSNYKNISNRLIIQNDSSSKALIYGEFDTRKIVVNGDLFVTGSINNNQNYNTIFDTLNNTILGVNALKTNTTGGRNVAIGYLSQISSLNANFNTSAGAQSLYTNTTGSNNSTLGANTLYSNTTGTFNVAVGASALYFNKSGNRNIGIGYESLNDLTSGSSNISIGHQSLFANKLGNENITLGSYSAQKWAMGNRNTIIGANSANTVLNGSNNIIIGADAGNYATSLDNKLIISNSSTSKPLIYGDFANNKIKFNADIDSLYILNRIYFHDENANDHIAKYDTGFTSPLIYARYFYGHYGDLVLQGMSKVYTGNIHFVTGSNMAGYDQPTQRMVIMDKGNIGIGNFVDDAPKAKLEVKDGDVFISNHTKGIILKSPNGSCWRVTIDDTGNFIRTSISCPTY